MNAPKEITKKKNKSKKNKEIEIPPFESPTELDPETPWSQPTESPTLPEKEGPWKNPDVPEIVPD